jgi:hypothetical protein
MKPEYLGTLDGQKHHDMLRHLLRTVGENRTWIDNVSSWALVASAGYITFLLANFDKVNPRLRNGWRHGVLLGITISIFAGVAIKIMSGFAGFVLAIEQEIRDALYPALLLVGAAIEAKLPDTLTPEERIKASIAGVQKYIAPVLDEFIGTIPLFIQWAARLSRRSADKDVLAACKIPARIYFYLQLWLAIQMISLAFAFVLPLWRLK